jgi:type VI secretion system protein ImpG
MSLNYLSLINTDSLKNILRTYDFVAVHDVQAERKAKKRLDGIKAFYSEPKDIIIKGYPVRGIESTLELDQDAFLNEGELYLFGTILSHFFSLYSSINSFHQLKVKNLTNNEVYQWGTQKGSQPVI